MADNETYMYCVYDSAYVCKKCEGGMPVNMDGESPSEYFSYCPFCGRKITAWYADESSAEWIEEEKAHDRQRQVPESDL